MSKKKNKCTKNVCVKIRKSFMDETLDFLKELRKEVELKKQQVA